MAFQWSKDSLVCVATYNILEGEEFLDEFEDADHPLATAGSLKMGQLLYFLHTASSDIMDAVAEMEAIEFLEHLRIFGAKRKPKQKISAIIKRLTVIFRDKDKTLRDLAQEVDNTFRFPS